MAHEGQTQASWRKRCPPGAPQSTPRSPLHRRMDPPGNSAHSQLCLVGYTVGPHSRMDHEDSKVAHYVGLCAWAAARSRAFMKSLSRTSNYVGLGLSPVHTIGPHNRGLWRKDSAQWALTLSVVNHAGPHLKRMYTHTGCTHSRLLGPTSRPIAGGPAWQRRAGTSHLLPGPGEISQPRSTDWPILAPFPPPAPQSIP